MNPWRTLWATLEHAEAPTRVGESEEGGPHQAHGALTEGPKGHINIRLLKAAVAVVSGILLVLGLVARRCDPPIYGAFGALAMPRRLRGLTKAAIAYPMAPCKRMVYTWALKDSVYPFLGLCVYAMIMLGPFRYEKSLAPCPFQLLGGCSILRPRLVGAKNRAYDHRKGRRTCRGWGDGVRHTQFMLRLAHVRRGRPQERKNKHLCVSQIIYVCRHASMHVYKSIVSALVARTKFHKALISGPLFQGIVPGIQISRICLGI